MTATTTQGLEMPVLITTRRPRAIQVILVGCGGTGTRILGPLAKMLSEGDNVILFDPDIVETRNLHRQAFTTDHVGRLKAEIAGERLSPDALRVGFHVRVFPMAATMEAIVTLISEATSTTVIIGAVDSRAARAEIQAALRACNMHATAWIDAGNETTSGQVVVTVQNYPVASLQRGGETETYAHAVLTCQTMRDVLPALLVPEVASPTAGTGCAIRLDAQTPAVNMLAAAYVTNALSWLLDGVPFCHFGAYFSTLGTVTPIRVKSAFPRRPRLDDHVPREIITHRGVILSVYCV